MSRVEEILEDIDLIKILIFLLIFIGLSLGIVFASIIPGVKEYRAEKTKHKRSFAYLKATEDVLKKRQNLLLREKNKNLRILTSFKKNFKEENFITHAKSFFESVSLSKKTKDAYEDDFEFYELNATSHISTPKVFYDFLDSLNRYENIIQSDFPIKMEAEEETIKAFFKIKVYKLKEDI